MRSDPRDPQPPGSEFQAQRRLPARGFREEPALEELLPGEDLGAWAERFVAEMSALERELERRRPRWTPLRLFGLVVR
jgi:hypothetical protein